MFLTQLGRVLIPGSGLVTLFLLGKTPYRSAQLPEILRSDAGTFADVSTTVKNLARIRINLREPCSTDGYFARKEHHWPPVCTVKQEQFPSKLFRNTRRRYCTTCLLQTRRCSSSATLPPQFSVQTRSSRAHSSSAAESPRVPARLWRSPPRQNSNVHRLAFATWTMSREANCCCSSRRPAPAQRSGRPRLARCR